uniref:Tripartite motif-containing protein 2 n=1 Tax=Magallana gigas TaxID=29159 RepID=K1Q518_MAGGI
MDPRSSAQDVHRCDLCETAIVHSYCDFCHVNLCKPCIEVALDLENQLANLDGGYEKITTEISKQGEQWHREIDIIINRMKTEINEIKKKHIDVLQKHLDEIRQTQSLMKQTLQALKDIQESIEVFRTIEYRSEVKDLSRLPNMVQISLPKFIPKPIDHEKLYSLFGHLTPFSTHTKENTLSLDLQNTSVRELLDEPELVRTITTGQHQYLRSVTCLEKDKIWTSNGTDHIYCFTIDGFIVQTIKTKSGILSLEIAVDSSGNLLFVDGTSTVYQVKNGQTEELIIFQGWRPNKMCVTSTGDLLVTMHDDDETQCKVVRYSGSTEKQTIQFDDEGKPLYSKDGYIKHITENKNRDICVADYKAGAVVVVNQGGKLKWRYTGHPSVTKNKPFNPYGITSDSQSRILTADGNNRCIHILDQNGQFLRYIDNCDLDHPYGLCVDNDDNLFVCEFKSKGNIKKIKYLK